VGFDANVIENRLLSGDETKGTGVLVDVTSGVRDRPLKDGVGINTMVGVVYTKVASDRAPSVDWLAVVGYGTMGEVMYTKVASD
jgi:hypothetical protein